MGTLTPIPTLPDKWCRLSASFVGTYEANRRYLGLENNLERTTTVNLEWQFTNEAQQKEFFDWWGTDVAHGGKTFYAKVPLFADNKLYLLVQSKPLIQKISPKYKISCQFMLYFGTSKDQSTAPVAHDTNAYVEENSSNNIISPKITDADGDTVHGIQFVGNHDGAIIKGSTVIYTPTAGFTGGKTIQYKAFDGVHWSNVANLQIQVHEIDAPIAWDMQVNVAETPTGTVDKDKREFPLNGFDPNGNALTYIITDAGNVTAQALINSAHIEVPIGMTTGTFKYKVNNGIKDSNEATVTITTKAPVAYDVSHIFPKAIRIPQSVVIDTKWIVMRGSELLTDKENATSVQLGVSGLSTKPPSLKDIARGLVGGGYKVTFRSSGVVSALDEKFDFIAHIDNVIAKQTITTPATMVSITNNTHYLSATDSNGNTHIPHGDTLVTGVFKTQPQGYPQSTDFPNVLNWDEATGVGMVQSGFTDVFSTYKVLNPDAQIPVTIDAYGVMTIIKNDSKVYEIQIEVSNPNGDKKVVKFGVFTHVVVP